MFGTCELSSVRATVKTPSLNCTSRCTLRPLPLDVAVSGFPIIAMHHPPVRVLGAFRPSTQLRYPPGTIAGSPSGRPNPAASGTAQGLARERSRRRSRSRHRNAASTLSQSSGAPPHRHPRRRLRCRDSVASASAAPTPERAEWSSFETLVARDAEQTSALTTDLEPLVACRDRKGP